MSEYVYATDGDTVQNMLSVVFEPLQEIVRCRDCANHTYTPKGSCRCDYWMTFVEPDGFCKWGERK